MMPALGRRRERRIVDDIRHYISKIAEASGVGSNDDWAARAGVKGSELEAFLAGSDVPLSSFLAICAAVDAFVLPIPSVKHDETVMLLESEGLFPEGASDPFAKYSGM